MDKHDFINDYLQGKHPIEQETWKLPTEGELDRDEALYDALLAERGKAPLHRGRGWGWVYAAAAVLVAVLALFTWKSFKPEGQPQLAEKTAEHVLQENTPKVVEELNVPNEPTRHVKLANEAHLIDQRGKPSLNTPQPKRKTHKKVKVENPPEEQPLLAETEPQQEEDVPTIPADKQALADIFLAEEALQVAFELRARQEAIRAYAASLTGRELPKPIIAF